MQWIAGLDFTADGQLLVTGFFTVSLQYVLHCSYLSVFLLQSDLIVYDMSSNQVLLKVECGGGHRSWDLFLSSEFTATLVHVKRHDVILNQGSLARCQRIVKVPCTC
jgi:hypothetical protein